MTEAHAGGQVRKHPYHLVDPSPWPVVGATGALFLFGGGVLFMHDYGPWVMILGVLLVLSDGADNASRYTEKDIRNAIQESDVQIYTIGVFMPIPYRDNSELRAGPVNLARLGEISGGQGFVLDNPADLPDLTGKISRELRTQYEISYYPSNQAHNGQWRKVRVKVKAPPGAPPLEARTRSGYYAPSF